jgi:hypothetical protein
LAVALAVPLTTALAAPAAAQQNSAGALTGNPQGPVPGSAVTSLGASKARASAPAQAAAEYFPTRFAWQHKRPEDVGIDSVRLGEAVKQAIASENVASRDLVLFLATTFGATKPFDTPIGPVQSRGPLAA